MMNKTPRKTSRNTIPPKGNQLDRILALMRIQGQMPIFPFVTKDEAYRRAGCDPRAAMFLSAE